MLGGCCRTVPDPVSLANAQRPIHCRHWRPIRAVICACTCAQVACVSPPTNDILSLCNKSRHHCVFCRCQFTGVFGAQPCDLSCINNTPSLACSTVALRLHYPYSRRLFFCLLLFLFCLAPATRKTQYTQRNTTHGSRNRDDLFAVARLP